MEKVLVTLPLTDSAIERLLSLPGYDFLFYTDDLSEDDLKDVEIIVGNPSNELIRRCPKRKWIQTGSAGVNKYLDLPEDIVLSNAYGAFGPGIGEFLTAEVLMATRSLPLYLKAQSLHEWGARGSERSVSSLKVLSVGMGAIGSAFLKQMAALGAECYGITRTKKENPDFVKECYTGEEIEEVLPDMDVIALSLPETPDTVHFMDEKKLSLCKKDSILLNVGRGTAIDTEALLKKLDEGHFSFVFLDVTDPEPLPKDHPLWDIDRVIITPHISGRTNNPIHFERVFNVIYTNLKNHSEGKELLHTVKKNIGY